MSILRIFALVLGFVLPHLCLAQQFSPYPVPANSSSGLSIRKAAYRSIAPKRFTTPLFAVPLLPLHRSPPDDLFVNEILLGRGSLAGLAAIMGTEENLRATRLFSRIETRLDTLRDTEQPKLTPTETDISLFLFERPSAAPFLIMETGGGTATSGVGASLSNVGGVGIALETSLVYRSENAIGWQGTVRAKWRLQEIGEELPMMLEANLEVHRFRNSEEFSIISPSSEKQPYNEWSVNLSHHGGMEFRYRATERSSMLNPAAYVMQLFDSWRVNSTGIIRGSYWDTDFYVSGTVQADLTKRGDDAFRYNSLDNTVLGLVEIGTEYRYGALLDEKSWGKESHFAANSLGAIVQTGFYARGGVIGGLILSGDGIVLHSYYPRTPLLLSVRAGGAVMPSQKIYLSFHGEFVGENLARAEVKYHIAFADGIILASRFMGVLPNGGFTQFDGTVDGVRGYGANTLMSSFGGFMGNLELRGLPLADFGAYRLSGTIFLDGALGLRTESISNYSSFGAGLRLKYPALLSSNGTEGVLRVDVAYVPLLGQVGQVIISTKEAFTLFDDFPVRQQRLIATQRFLE